MQDAREDQQVQRRWGEVVGLSGARFWACSPRAFRIFRILSGFGLLCLVGCATGDSARLKSSREHFSKGEFERAEGDLYSSEVLERKESRLQHFLWLASLGAGQRTYEKVLYYSDRARELALELRSDRGGYDWLSSEYKSNPIEFSCLHYFLVISNLILAEDGASPQWSIPELKLKNGTILVPAQDFPARTYTPREIAEFRMRARAELKAWNQFLEVLKRTYPNQPFYQEDLLARLLGAFVHGGSSTLQEKRTGELLASDGLRFLDGHPGPSIFDENESGLRDFLKRLLDRASSSKRENSHERLVLIETGVMPELKPKKVIVGLSSIFERVEDPVLRAELERIGFHVLIQFAPEFGLIAFSGAVAGAISSGPDDAPKSLSGAIDRSFGFEISFPAMEPGSTVRNQKLILNGGDGKRFEFSLQPMGPIREILSRELSKRREKEWSAKAVKIGVQYLSILIPAVAAYREATRENNVFKKLAILAGFFIAKKMIDRANAPDLRSWSLLPELISGNLLSIPPGSYSVEFSQIRGDLETKHSLGEWKLTENGPFFLHRRVFDSGARDL